LANIKLPEEDRKNRVSIRLPQWMIDQILERGNMQEIIEGILRKHIKKKVNRPKE
jgi:acetyl-CoA carboxylase beta subunit